jgi:DNA-binding transcriptional regulator YiaG
MKNRKRATGKSAAAKPLKRKAKGRSAFAVAGTSTGRDSDPVRRLSRTYHLSNEALSRVTGASPRTVAYWNAGMAPQRSSAQKLKEISRLFDALADIIKAKAIGTWLQQPNKGFDGSTPLQVIERGESDRVWRMIWQLREGNTG